MEMKGPVPNIIMVFSPHACLMMVMAMVMMMMMVLVMVMVMSSVRCVRVVFQLTAAHISTRKLFHVQLTQGYPCTNTRTRKKNQ
jgi:hypothetical protein